MFLVEYFLFTMWAKLSHGMPDVASQKFKGGWGKVGKHLRMGEVWMRPRKVSHGGDSTSIGKVRKAESDAEKQEF